MCIARKNKHVFLHCTTMSSTTPANPSSSGTNTNTTGPPAVSPNPTPPSPSGSVPPTPGTGATPSTPVVTPVVPPVPAPVPTPSPHDFAHFPRAKQRSTSSIAISSKRTKGNEVSDVPDGGLWLDRNAGRLCIKDGDTVVYAHLRLANDA